MDVKKMKKLIPKLKTLAKDTCGAAGAESIGMMATILVVMILIVLSVTVFGAYIKVSKVNTIAGEIMRIAEIKGSTEIDAETSNILTNSGLAPDTVTVQWECDYIAGTKKIQLGGKLKISITTNAKVGVGSIAVLDIPITGKATGISERYWK